MPHIRPISDLRNRSREISKLCHSSGAPVFITKNGKEDLVVLSQSAYDQQQARLELYERLEEAAADAKTGRGAISHARMMRKLRQPH